MDFLTVAKGLLRFLWKKKVWWLAPIIIMLAIVVFLVFFTQSATISPFVYALF